jgi:hypothetical protein
MSQVKDRAADCGLERRRSFDGEAASYGPDPRTGERNTIFNLNERGMIH